MLGNLLKYKSIVYNYIKPLQELIASYFVISIKQSEDTHLQLYSRNIQNFFSNGAEKQKGGLIAI